MYFESTSCDCSQKWKASPVRVTNPLQQNVLLKYDHYIDYEDSQDCKGRVNQMNFRKNSKRPSIPPHFRKTMLQIFYDTYDCMQGFMMAR